MPSQRTHHHQIVRGLGQMTEARMPQPMRSGFTQTPQAAEQEFQRYPSHAAESVRQKLHTLLTEAGQQRV
jgi:hypothetical protein